jgi:hypothetical protein
MPRILADIETREEPTSVSGTLSRDVGVAGRVSTAYRLTDQSGHLAFVWWDGAAVVDAEDTAFRRRVLRALKTPIWTVEDVPDEHGLTLTTRVLLQPDDPRYPSSVFFHWHQIGLGDLEDVDVVKRDDRQPIETPRHAVS